MKKGFTLAEVAVASVIILVVLFALGIALISFVRGSRSLELQEGALTVARVEITRMERRGEPPSIGRTTRPDTLWGHEYTVDTAVTYYDENSVNVLVSVDRGDSVSIELTRRFYIDQ